MNIITYAGWRALHRNACANETTHTASSNGVRFEVNLRQGWVTALLIGFAALGVAQRGAAQVFPGQNDDTTSSMGVFQITVDPAFRPLVAAVGAFAAYPGYNPANGQLTSPLCIDNATTIGRSAPHSRPYTFPVPLGAGSWDTINGYGDYAAIPALWSGAASPTEEVLTEIKSFVLLSVAGDAGQHCPPDPRIPSVPLMWPMVTAGTGAGVTPRSLGIVQENTVNGPPPPDFPAHSFFNIFVNVSLPQIPSTESSVAFPVAGALFYNDSPLIITNLALNNFPPTVIYIHGETPAVPIKFKTSHPPYWTAGDIFGYLVLAGHGTITNDCNNTPAVNALLDGALGPVGNPRPGLPVEWLRTNTLCPPPGSAYVSVQGTNSSGASLDAISFPGGPVTIFVRNFVHTNLTNPIQPPPPNGNATYFSPNTLVTFDFSVGGQGWNSGAATGPVSISIHNSSGTGSTSTYDTEMTQLSLTGIGTAQGLQIRESPTLASLGQHTIRPDPRGVRVSSVFDVFLEVSTDGGVNWIPANRSIRMEASAPPAAPNSIYVTHTGTSVKLNWLGTFQLQSASSVTGPYHDLQGITTGPFPVNTLEDQVYFRLRQ